jgi:hypothetical protein
MWRELHARLTPAQRRKLRSTDPADRFAIDPALVEQVVKDHARVSVGMGEERFQRVLTRLESGRDVAGAGQSGVSERGMVVFSPQLVAHYLENAAWVYHCGRAYEPAPAPDSFGSCFGKPFPEAAVAVKATFNPRASGVAAFDTSAAGLERLMTATGADAERWRQRSDPAGRPVVVRLDDDASLAKIHSIKLRDQDFLVGEYVLTGLHVTTKETAEWVWTTLWWSNEPDTDFGADRPAAFGGGDPAWKNYKMCVATTWDEKDPVVTGDAAPQGLPVDLMQALRAAHAYARPSTWCSNPFIEGMPRGANSNCIGCHQHAGPRGMPPASQAPDRGRKASAFPGDFLASFLRAGEGFQPELRSVVDDFPEDE